MTNDTIFSRCAKTDHAHQQVTVFQNADGPYKAMCQGCGTILLDHTDEMFEEWLGTTQRYSTRVLVYDRPMPSLDDMTERGWDRAWYDEGRLLAETESGTQIVVTDEMVQLFDVETETELHLGFDEWVSVAEADQAAEYIQLAIEEADEDEDDESYERLPDDERCYTCGNDEYTIYVESCGHHHCPECGHAIEDVECYVDPDILFESQPWQHQLYQELTGQGWPTVEADEEELNVVASDGYVELVISDEHVTIRHLETSYSVQYTMAEWEEMAEAGGAEMWETGWAVSVINQLLEDLATAYMAYCEMCSHSQDVVVNLADGVASAICPACEAGQHWQIATIVERDAQAQAEQAAESVDGGEFSRLAPEMDMQIGPCPCGCESITLRMSRGADFWSGSCPICKAEYRLDLAMPTV